MPPANTIAATCPTPPPTLIWTFLCHRTDNFQQEERRPAPPLPALIRRDILAFNARVPPPSHASWYSGTDLTHRLCRGCLACASKHKMRALLDLISQLRERTVPSWGGPRRHDNDGRLPTYSIITFDFGGASVAMVPYPLASFFCDSRKKG